MKIYVTRQIPAQGITMLTGEGHEVIVSEKDDSRTHDELLAALREHEPDALLSLLTDRIDGELLDAVPSLRIIANYAVGYDNIDLAAAAARGVIVTNTPDVLTDSVAEHTIALMLALSCRIVESDRFVRNGHYTGWAPMLLLGNDLKGKTLGILGAGRIGSHVASIAHHGLGMRIAYYDTAPRPQLESACAATFVPAVDDLLASADVISIHLPLTDTTRHLIDATRLAAMKPSSFLVNTARGPIIDEAALVDALREKRIKGAALDVFEHEPTLTPGLVALDNVILTPHTASSTEETREKMSEMAAANIIAFGNGETPPNRIAMDA